MDGTTSVSSRVKRARRRWRRRRGSEVLELALLLPLLLALTFGTVEFGFYFYLQHNIQAAAREGARAGVPYGATEGDAEAKASAFLTNANLNPANFSISAVIAGESQLTVVSAVPTLAHLRAGRLKPLGITTQRRSPLLPEVATIAETVPGYEVTHWYGIWGPKGLRPAIVERWNKEVAKVMTGEEMRKQMQGEGLELAAGPPEQLHQYIRKDVEKWRKVIRDGNIGREG